MTTVLVGQTMQTVMKNVGKRMLCRVQSGQRCVAIWMGIKGPKIKNVLNNRRARRVVEFTAAVAAAATFQSGHTRSNELCWSSNGDSWVLFVEWRPTQNTQWLAYIYDRHESNRWLPKNGRPGKRGQMTMTVCDLVLGLCQPTNARWSHGRS